MVPSERKQPSLIGIPSDTVNRKTCKGNNVIWIHNIFSDSDFTFGFSGKPVFMLVLLGIKGLCGM